MLGGSQGSRPLNRHFSIHHAKYTADNIQILWQCGKLDYPALKEVKSDALISLFPFSEDMATVYSAADVIISRAGALALSEMALMGKAMILVPFPHAAGDHQLKNAESFAIIDAAKIVPQSRLDSGELEDTVMSLLKQPDILSSMEKKALSLATPSAEDKIICAIMEIAES